MAIVFSYSGFDALLWETDPDDPNTIDSIVVGNEELIPTNNSIKRDNNDWWKI